MVVIGDKRVNENHVCDPNLVATTELITTKPCPKCGERIQKQMVVIKCGVLNVRLHLVGKLVSR